MGTRRRGWELRHRRAGDRGTSETQIRGSDSCSKGALLVPRSAGLPGASSVPLPTSRLRQHTRPEPSPRRGLRSRTGNTEIAKVEPACQHGKGAVIVTVFILWMR